MPPSLERKPYDATSTTLPVLSHTVVLPTLSHTTAVVSVLSHPTCCFQTTELSFYPKLQLNLFYPALFYPILSVLSQTTLLSVSSLSYTTAPSICIPHYTANCSIPHHSTICFAPRYRFYPTPSVSSHIICLIPHHLFYTTLSVLSHVICLIPHHSTSHFYLNTKLLSALSHTTALSALSPPLSVLSHTICCTPHCPFHATLPVSSHITVPPVVSHTTPSVLSHTIDFILHYLSYPTLRYYLFVSHTTELSVLSHATVLRGICFIPHRHFYPTPLARRLLWL